MTEFFNSIAEQKELLWSVQMFFIIFLALIVSFSVGRTISRLEKKFCNNGRVWDDLILRAVGKPVKVLIWILGIVLAGKVTGDYANTNLNNTISLTKNLGIVFCISWFIWRLVREYEVYLTKSSKNLDITTVIAVTKLLKATVIMTAMLMTLQTLGVNISGIIAFGGVGGAVIGFAAKDLLANFFGAMTVYLDRPFSVGDWIRSPDREMEGTVEYIGWRLTHIRTFSSRMLYVPNSVFSTVTIENPSRMSHRRIHEVIGVRYKDTAKVATITTQIREMLMSHEEVNQNATLMVYLDKFDQYSVNFFVYCFTKTKDWSKYHGVKQDILLKVNDIVSKNESEIAFPTSVISFDSSIAVESKVKEEKLPVV
jgi:MscS family membrane protein